MAQLLKHYFADRDNPSVFAVSPGQFSRPMFGTVTPNIQGLEIVQRLTDENGIEFCLSTCPDEVEVTPTEGLEVIDQTIWDGLIASHDARQEARRWDIVRKYRNIILNLSDWAIIKAKETGEYLSADFKDWRQSLRDLPAAATFPTSLPALPESNEGVVIDQSVYSSYISELRSIPMINDPLPPDETVVSGRPSRPQ